MINNKCKHFFAFFAFAAKINKKQMKNEFTNPIICNILSIISMITSVLWIYFINIQLDLLLLRLNKQVLSIIFILLCYIWHYIHYTLHISIICIIMDYLHTMCLIEKERDQNNSDNIDITNSTSKQR